MLEIVLDVHRGSFHLQMDCRFTSEWTVLFGPSGAGKSTLLRLLAGLPLPERPRPESLRIALDGQILTDSGSRTWIKPGRRHTSMVTQQPALFPHRDVASNVVYGITSGHWGIRAARVEEMLELVGALELLRRRPKDLSGGEAQRVALARALAPMPRLLLLDEPFSALDGAASDVLITRLQPWLKEHHVQTILATHDATDALATSAEVVLLREGRLVAQGPADEVLAEERSRLARRLNPL